MEHGTMKDWLDAVREQYLPDGAVPSPDGWSVVGRKLRRAAARRRALLAATVVLPAAAILLLLWRQPANTGSPVVQENGPIIETESASRAEPSVLLPQSGRSRLADGAPFGRLPIHPTRPTAPDSTGNRAQAPAPSAPRQPQDATPASPSSITAPDEDGVLNKPRRRPRVSVGLRAGSATVRRNAPISMVSAPYLAALNFLNTTDPSLMPRVKSNTSNTAMIAKTANAFFPESTSGQYTHDLPLSFGLSLRLDLTPKIGLETGLEYTYLHSLETFAGSRLNQRLHFIGIPVRLEGNLWTNGPLGFYAGVGGKVEKCVSATLGRVACEEPRLQWSAEAFGGVQYQLMSRASLYFQPAVSYYFTKTDLPTYRTEHPLGLTLHAGLRLDL